MTNEQLAEASVIISQLTDLLVHEILQLRVERESEMRAAFEAGWDVGYDDALSAGPGKQQAFIFWKKSNGGV